MSSPLCVDAQEILQNTHVLGAMPGTAHSPATSSTVQGALRVSTGDSLSENTPPTLMLRVRVTVSALILGQKHTGMQEQALLGTTDQQILNR